MQGLLAHRLSVQRPKRARHIKCRVDESWLESASFDRLGTGETAESHRCEARRRDRQRQGCRPAQCAINECPDNEECILGAGARRRDVVTAEHCLPDALVAKDVPTGG